MISTPSISVIVPVFNDATGLQRCLDSVLAQDVSRLEVLVVDDGSTDTTLAVAHACAQRDSRVRVIRQANAGAGAARNCGIDAAEGQYIHFLDADDQLAPGAYSIWLNAALAHSYADVLLCNHREQDAQTKAQRGICAYGLTGADLAAGPVVMFRAALLQGPVMPWNKLIKRAWLNTTGIRFDELKSADDRSFHFRLVTQARQVVLLGAELVIYTVSNDRSLSGNVDLMLVDNTLSAFRNISRYMVDETLEDQRTIFSKNMEDLMRVVGRSHDSQKAAMTDAVASGLQGGWLPFKPTAFGQKAWYSEYRNVDALSRIYGDKEGRIPLVFAVNQDYLPYLAVALQSVSETLAPGKRCLVYVLHLGLSDAARGCLMHDLNLHNIDIHDLNMVKILESAELPTRAHYSREIYLRLWIPELFKGFEKVIYLDADLVVRRSLHELFETDLAGADLAGVRDFNNAQHRRYVQDQLGVSADAYVNSGVLVFNTRQCMQNHFRERCLHALGQHELLYCPDQDMINIACQGRIKLLSPGWNCLWNYGFAKHRLPPDGPAWFAGDLVEARLNLHIIHFSSAIKPWKEPQHEDADLFWQVARRSPLYLKVLHSACASKVRGLHQMVQLWGDELNKP